MSKPDLSSSIERDFTVSGKQMVVLSSEAGSGWHGRCMPSVGTPGGTFGRAVAVASLGLCVLSSVAEPAAASRRHHEHGDSGGKSAKPEAPKPTGPLILAISIGGQKVTVYDNGTPIATSRVSTGMAGHATPMGIFSVIQKQRWHHSNLYSNAPMPYMQRITWSGVALHEGVVPGYPASHGCIRLPGGFATRLWGMTKVGARVIIARSDLAPYEIDHPRLAALTKVPEPAKTEGDGMVTSGVIVVATTGAVTAVDSAQNSHADAEHAAAPVAPASPPQVAANPGKEPAAETGQTGEPATAPPPAPQVEPSPASKIDEGLQHPGQLSLFVSRREGKLFVRKGFTPVFDAPVTIAHPEMPLGTHLFTASRPAAEGAGVRWLAVSLDRAAAGGSARGKHKGRQGAPVAEAPRISARQAAVEALDRIELPQEVLERLAPLMVPGSSLLISDQGLGGETGKDTDFIVVTR